MSWLKILLARIIKELLKHGPELYEIIRKLAPTIRDWLNGKKIAVIGQTAVGKNSFYRRLNDEAIPDEHHETKGAEIIPNFKYECNLPGGKQFAVSFKRCINAGGDIEQRDRYWMEVCKDSDIVFYMISLEDMKKGEYRKPGSVYHDLKWLATHLNKMQPNTLIHFLVNKIDQELVDTERYMEFVAQNKPQIDELEQVSRSLLGDYQKRFTGTTLTSMKDDHVFAVSFPKALEAVYAAVHS
jgi:hypothetical protein